MLVLFTFISCFYSLQVQIVGDIMVFWLFSEEDLITSDLHIHDPKKGPTQSLRTTALNYP